MTQTIKLSDSGGITFDANHRLEMVGEMNKISFPEVKQRTRIRFETQRMANMMHPYEGFDLYSIRRCSSDANSLSMPVTPEILIEQEIQATIAQDPAIDWQNSEIIIKNLGDRTYAVRLKYGIKGSSNKLLEYSGDVMMI